MNRVESGKPELIMPFTSSPDLIVSHMISATAATRCFILAFLVGSCLVHWLVVKRALGAGDSSASAYPV